MAGIPLKRTNRLAESPDGNQEPASPVGRSLRDRHRIEQVFSRPEVVHWPSSSYFQGTLPIDHQEVTDLPTAAAIP